MKKEIGKNVSSGAEKVETIEKREAAEVDPPVTKSKKAGTMSEGKPKKTTKTAAKRAPGKSAELKEEAAANERVEKAKKRAAEKENRAEKRASVKEAKIEKRAAVRRAKLEKQQKIAEKKLARRELIAKKRAELKERRVERRAEKNARREMLKNESKTERQKRLEREKRDRLALKRRRQEARERARENARKAREATHARRAEDKKHRREQKTERRKGYGGWLAAVISLGTVCLVLSAIVTAGAFRMNDMTVAGENTARSTLYEMVSVSEDLDENLGKLRISSGADEQRRLLTDILVDTALLESAIEKLPVDNATGTDISSFVNRTGAYAREMLAKLARGSALSEDERSQVIRLYETNDKLYSELNELVGGLSDDDLRALMKGSGSMAEKLGELARGTRPDGETLTDAPFAEEGNIGENRLGRFSEVSSSEAEELARDYFADYRIKDVRYTGETVTEEIACYNFVLTDENGVEIFAQLSKRGGKLVFFNTYETCEEKNFDLEACDALAREFLKGLGIEDVEAVWLSDGGMVANLTYTTVESGVRIYPELIRVRVCESRGRVVGLDAKSYLLNDKSYKLDHVLSEADAERLLTAGLEPYSANLALIPVEGREVLCFEFGCTYGEEEYIVYLDADTGEEVCIFRVRASSGGSYLR